MWGRSTRFFRGGRCPHRPETLREGFVRFLQPLCQRPLPYPHFGWVPPGAPFLSRQERGKECGSRGALTAACSRRRADVLVVRLPPAIDSLDSLRDAPPSLKNPSRRAFTLEKQCFGGSLSKHSLTRKFIKNNALLLFSHGENSLQKSKLVFYSAPVRTLAWNTRMTECSSRKWPQY